MFDRREPISGQQGQCGGPHGVRAGRSASAEPSHRLEPVWPIVGQNEGTRSLARPDRDYARSRQR